jgi:hypothetical protein
MSVQIEDYINVAERAAELGCLAPAGITIMPENFDAVDKREDFKVREEGSTIRTLLRNNGFQIGDLLPAGERVPSIHNKSADWMALISISTSMVANNPELISTAIDLIQVYLKDFFKSEQAKSIKMAVISERTSDRVYKKLTYEGDIAGLSELGEAIRDVFKP